MTNDEKPSKEPSLMISKAAGNRQWYNRIFLALIELPIAFGLGWLVDYQIYEAVRRASGQELGIVGVLVSALALCAGAIVAIIFYWKLVANRNYRSRLVVDAIAIFAILLGLVQPITQAKAVTDRDITEKLAIKTKAQSAYRTWVEKLKESGQHGPPGLTPPMLKVVDDGITISVTNNAEKEISVALARVRQNRSVAASWQSCGMYSERNGLRYYYLSLSRGESAIYRPYEKCAEDFRNALIEYRVGGGGSSMVDHAAEIGWWSDSAFAAVQGRE